MTQSLLHPALLERYGKTPLPRYTSYPPANLWSEQGESLAQTALATVGNRPLSLYVHVPFCRKLCLYCGCNMMVTRSQDLVSRYLAALDAEVERVAALLPERGDVVQLHLGGGTPTYLDAQQLTQLWQSLTKRFQISRGCETSIEIHPPVTTDGQLQRLAELGFSRVSMGVQDFDPIVQKRINRIQPFEQTRDLVLLSRRLGFVSVNMDLMYGLPLQTVERFSHTIDRVAVLRPDRIALFGYAHMPQLRKHQSVFRSDELPDPPTRAALFELAMSRLLDLGYVYVGLDHFALPNDELLVARQRGELRRNFMGYTTCKSSEVLAFGPSSISELGRYYLQNARDVVPYCERVESGALPIVRGYCLSDDDLIRRDLIMQLLCNLMVSKSAIATRYGIDFDSYFATERQALEPLIADGLCGWQGDELRILPPGQLLLRTVASVFDATLHRPAPRHHAAAV
jgi:oxygen-independent coproporphyrinogen-3 oxidase